MFRFQWNHMKAARPTAYLATLAMVCLLVAGCSGSSGSFGAATKTPVLAVPHFDHMVVVIEENHSYQEINGAVAAPYINGLAAKGALFTNAYAVSHPSEPDYLALFAGSTFGLTSDACPQHYDAANLGSELIEQKLTFTGFSEDLPSAGFTGCSAGGLLDPPYARKHNPWVNFANIPAASNQSFNAFPKDFTQLPTVAFVVPNQQHDMHSGTIGAGDAWLKASLDGYISWATSHNSLLILTYDEDDNGPDNHILTFFYGAHVKTGNYGTTINHYDVLRTIEAAYSLPFTGSAAQGTTITGVWQA